MHFRLPALALTAGLLASAGALSAQDIPADAPLQSLLDSAQTHLRNGETGEALVYYDAAIAKDPSNYLSFFKRATTFLSLGRTGQATSDFNRVLALRPGFEGAHLQLAKIKAKQADWDGARADYLAAGRAPESPDIADLDEAHGAVALAEAAEAAAQWEECVNHAGAAIMVASRAPALRELRARCRFERGEIEEGVGDLRHVIGLRPGDTGPHVVVSASTFYGLGDLDSGIAQVKKCLHSDPDSKVCKKLHKQQKAIQKTFSKVEGQLNKGQPTTAGRTIVGTEEEPGLMQTVKEQLDQLREDGSIPSKARMALHEKVVEMACQAYTEGNHKDAAKYCDQILELDSDSFWGLMHRGRTLLKQEDFEGAIRALEKAGEVRPEYKKDKVHPVLQKAQVALKRSKTKDYYKVLGVASDADERQIKSAYRKASKLYHPDKAAKQDMTKEQAEKKMAAINEAYEVLSDPELRARFDRGDDPNSQEGQQAGGPFHGSPFGGGHPFMHQQGGGGGGGFKFHFGGQNPFGF